MPNYNPELLRFKSMMDFRNPFSNGNPPDSQIPSVPNPSPSSQMIPGPSPSPMDQQEEDPISSIVNRLYHPSHEVADKFNKVWSEMPTHEKPSILRKIVASMVGLGDSGIKGADAVLNDPYNEKMGEWTNKLKMLQPLLGDERYQNTNERMIATNAASQSVANKRADTAIAAEKEKERANLSKEDISRQRAAAYIYKQNHPNHVFKMDKDGKLIAINPQDNSTEFVTDELGNPVKQLSDTDKINLQVGGRLKEIAASGAQTRSSEDNAEENRQKDIAARGSEGRKPNPNSSVGANANGTQEDKSITYELNPDGTQKLDPNGKPIPKSITTIRKPLTKKIRMKAPNGSVILVPEDKVKEAKSHGAEELK